MTLRILFVACLLIGNLFASTVSAQQKYIGEIIHTVGPTCPPGTVSAGTTIESEKFPNFHALIDREGQERIANGTGLPGDSVIKLPEISVGTPEIRACITVDGLFPYPHAEEELLNSNQPNVIGSP
ncbi:hypothetical protein MWN63_15350 [Paradonghicola geojensis]|nr:hypothetical protein [Marivivens geojensis]